MDYATTETRAQELLNDRQEKAMKARMTYLANIAKLFGVPMEPGWSEQRMRQQLSEYSVKQGGIKSNGLPASPPKPRTIKSAPQMHGSTQTKIEFADNVLYGDSPQVVGAIESNIPYITREKRESMLRAMQPKLDPLLSVIRPGQSFQVQTAWSKSIAMVWAARAKKYRDAKNLNSTQFDIRTGPDPLDPKFSRVWRTV